MNKVSIKSYNPKKDYIIPREKLDSVFERLNEADSILIKMIEGKSEAFEEAKEYLWSVSRLNISGYYLDKNKDGFSQLSADEMHEIYMED